MTAVSPTKTEFKLDARQRRTRNALRVALRQLAKSTPFRDITVSRLTEAAAVGRQTFYRHYPDLNALLADHFADDLAAQLDLAETLNRDGVAASEIIRELARFACECIAADPLLYSALLNGSAGTDAVRLFRGQVDALIQHVRLLRPLRDTTAQRLANSSLAGAISGFLLCWLEEGLTPSPQAAAELLVTLVIPAAPDGQP